MKKKKTKSAVAKVTLFSLDPVSSEPYLNIQQAITMIQYHIWNHLPYALKLHDMEDIVQMVLLKMAASTYKPGLSAPKTFATRIIQTRTLQVMQLATGLKNSYDSTNVNKKTGKPLRVPMIPVSENIEVGPDGDAMRLTEGQSDGVTPEDELLKKELVKHVIDLPVTERRKFLKDQGYNATFRVNQRMGAGFTWDKTHDEYDDLVGMTAKKK